MKISVEETSICQFINRNICVSLTNINNSFFPTFFSTHCSSTMSTILSFIYKKSPCPNKKEKRKKKSPCPSISEVHIPIGSNKYAFQINRGGRTISFNIFYLYMWPMRNNLDILNDNVANEQHWQKHTI